jgi:hypothetical protein
MTLNNPNNRAGQTKRARDVTAGHTMINSVSLGTPNIMEQPADFHEVNINIKPFLMEGFGNLDREFRNYPTVLNYALRATSLFEKN